MPQDPLSWVAPTEPTKKLTIVAAIAELFPGPTTGGLGQAGADLTRAIAELGHDVSVFVPFHKGSDHAGIRWTTLFESNTIPAQVGHQTVWAGLKRGALPGSKVRIYSVTNDHYFGSRDGLYVDPKTDRLYPDTAERWIAFCRWVLHAIALMRLRPDVVHCHDVHTALIPALLKLVHGAHPTLGRPASIYTIHNLSFQIDGPRSTLDLIGLGGEHFAPMGSFEFWGNVSFVKAALTNADKLTTVSPTYASEIQKFPDFSGGLDGVLRARADDLEGILNGVNKRVWDPKIDSLIPARYSQADLSGKIVNRAALLKEFCLTEPTDSAPVIGVVSRLTDDKVGLLLECLDEIVALGIRLVVLGRGDCMARFEKARKRYPGIIGLADRFDSRLSHLIQAGSDMTVMPSWTEPCGLSQLFAMTYGTIPVVSRRGGLNDTVDPCDASIGRGTGFVFSEYSSAAFFAEVCRAVNLFKHDRSAWQDLIQRAMAKDWSWAPSAERYVALYRAAMARRVAIEPALRSA